MSNLSFSFLGPNVNPLGLPFTVNTALSTSATSIQQLSGGWAPEGPSSTQQTGYALYLNEGFLNDQSVSASIKSIAGPLATMSISAASQSGSNTTYTYTLTSGTPVFQGMDIVISGMANPGNNGDFVVTGTGAGTFTVSNNSGVTENGSSGTGKASSDSLCGLGVRMTPDGQNGYFTFIGTNSGKAAGSEDSRVYTVELWVVQSGVPVFLGLIFPPPVTVIDSPNDVYKLQAAGNQITLFKNGNPVTMQNGSGGTPFSSFTDIYGQKGGYPAVVASSLSNATPTVGNSGTVWTNWSATDGVPTVTSGFITRAFDAFSATNVPIGLNASIWSAASHFTIVAGIPAAGTCTNGSGLYTGRTWKNDQSSAITLLTATGNTSVDLLLRSDSTGSNCYLAQLILTNGFSAGGTLSLFKVVAGTLTSIISPIAIPTISASDVVRVEAHGTTLNIVYNGVQKGTVVDATRASGTPGFLTNASTVTFSRWEGDEFSSAFGVSGNAGHAGATVTWSGPSAGSTTADSSGNYNTGEVLQDSGVYTFIPSQTGFVFSPTGSVQTINGADVGGVNFTATSVTPPFTPGISVIYPGAFNGKTLSAAFTNPSNQDLLQVVNEGGNVVWNLSPAGTATFNPATPTPNALIGKFFGSSFATAFPNPSKSDILQVIAPGDTVVFYVDFQGNAHSH